MSNTLDASLQRMSRAIGGKTADRSSPAMRTKVEALAKGIAYKVGQMMEEFEDQVMDELDDPGDMDEAMRVAVPIIRREVG